MENELSRVLDGRTTQFIMKPHIYIDYWLPFLVNKQAGVNDIYDILLRFINNQPEHPLYHHSWPSYPQIRKRAGRIGKTKVSTSLKLLVKYGLIHIDKDPVTRYNIYTILDIPEPPKEVLKFLGIDTKEKKEKVKKEKGKQKKVLSVPKVKKKVKLKSLPKIQKKIKVVKCEKKDPKKEKEKITLKILTNLPKAPKKKEVVTKKVSPEKRETPIRKAVKPKTQDLLKHWLEQYEKILGVKPANLNKTETVKYLSICKHLLKAFDDDLQLMKDLVEYFIKNYSYISGYTGDIPTLEGLSGFKNAVVLKMKKEKASGRKIAYA